MTQYGPGRVRPSDDRPIYTPWSRSVLYTTRKVANLEYLVQKALFFIYREIVLIMCHLTMGGNKRFVIDWLFCITMKETVGAHSLILPVQAEEHPILNIIISFASIGGTDCTIVF